ncbi:MAG: DUF188 domain-containing protein [Treponema sp.]|nr:DUF188 domain-containing protein [Treponema sp.]
MNKETVIYVDADSCPAKVRTVIQKKASSLSIKLVFVSNRPIPFDFENPLFKSHICPIEKDSADNHIVKNMTQNDIAVTRDILLAERLVKLNFTVINDRGTVFTKEKTERMIEERNLSMQMEALGLHKGKDKKNFGEKELSAFTKTFDEVLKEKLNVLD